MGAVNTSFVIVKIDSSSYLSSRQPNPTVLATTSSIVLLFCISFQPIFVREIFRDN